jgi:hypothetical protein
MNIIPSHHSNQSSNTFCTLIKQVNNNEAMTSHLFILKYVFGLCIKNLLIWTLKVQLSYISEHTYYNARHQY